MGRAAAVSTRNVWEPPSSLTVLWLTEGGIRGEGLRQNVSWKKTKLALGQMLNCQPLKEVDRCGQAALSCSKHLASSSSQ